MVVGKKAQALQLPRGVINNGGGLSPSSALGVALLAQIKKGLLERTAIVRQADVFNDAIIAMLFAVFLASDEAKNIIWQEYARATGGERKGMGLHYSTFSVSYLECPLIYNRLQKSFRRK